MIVHADVDTVYELQMRSPCLNNFWASSARGSSDAVQQAEASWVTALQYSSMQNALGVVYFSGVPDSIELRHIVTSTGAIAAAVLAEHTITLEMERIA